MIFPESGKSLILAFLVYFPLLISPRPMEADEESAQEDDKTGYNWDSWTSYIIPGAGVVCTIMAITLCACAACKNQVRPFLNGETPHNKAIREMLLQARSEHPNPKLAQLTKRMYDLGVRAETATRAMNSLDELTRLRIEQSELQMCGGKEAIVNEFRKAEKANYEPVGVHRPVSQMSSRSPSTWSMASYQRPLPRLPLSSSSSMMNRPLPMPPIQCKPAKPPTPYYQSEERKAIEVGNRFDEYTLYEEGGWNEYGLLKAAREAKSTCEGAAGLDKAADFDEYTVYDEGQLNLYGILKEQRRIENQVDAGCEPSSAYEDYYLDAGEFQQPSNMKEIAVGKEIADAIRKEEAVNKKIPLNDKSKSNAAEKERKAAKRVEVAGVARLMEVAKGSMVVSDGDSKSPAVSVCNETIVSIENDQFAPYIEKTSTVILKDECAPVAEKERPASVAGIASDAVVGKDECSSGAEKEQPFSVKLKAPGAVSGKECTAVVKKGQSPSVEGKPSVAVVGGDECASVIGDQRLASVVEKASAIAGEEGCEDIAEKERPVSVAEMAYATVVKMGEYPAIITGQPASPVGKTSVIAVGNEQCNGVVEKTRSASVARNTSVAVVNKEKCTDVTKKEQTASAEEKAFGPLFLSSGSSNIPVKERPASVAGTVSGAGTVIKTFADATEKDRPASIAEMEKHASDCETIFSTKNISKKRSVKEYISFYENNIASREDQTVLSETVAYSRPKSKKFSTGSLCEEVKIGKQEKEITMAKSTLSQANAISSRMSARVSTDSMGLTQLPKSPSSLLSRPLPPVPKPTVKKKATDANKNKTGVDAKAPFDEYTVYDEGSLNPYGALKAAKEAECVSDAVIGADNCGDEYTVYYEGAMNEYGLLKDAREAKVECGTGQEAAAGFDDYTEYAKSPIDENKEISLATEIGTETEKSCDFDEYAASFSGNDRAAVDTGLQSELGRSETQPSIECRSASEFSEIESDAVAMETANTVGELLSTPKSPSPVFKAQKSAKRVRVRRRVKKAKSRKIWSNYVPTSYVTFTSVYRICVYQTSHLPCLEKVNTAGLINSAHFTDTCYFASHPCPQLQALHVRHLCIMKMYEHQSPDSTPEIHHTRLSSISRATPFSPWGELNTPLGSYGSRLDRSPFPPTQLTSRHPRDLMRRYLQVTAHQGKPHTIIFAFCSPPITSSQIDEQVKQTTKISNLKPSEDEYPLMILIMKFPLKSTVKASQPKRLSEDTPEQWQRGVAIAMNANFVCKPAPPKELQYIKCVCPCQYYQVSRG